MGVLDESISIVEVDERDSSWEVSRPRFRVYLHSSAEDTTLGGTATYDITGADVLQVIDWAQRQVHGNDTYAIALVVDDAEHEALNPGHGRGLVWLVGTDGTNSDPDQPVAGDQQRMLARRTHPVAIPPLDTMPATEGTTITRQPEF